MCAIPGESFPKRVRLRKRAQYLAVQNGNLKVVSRAFIGLVRLRNDGPAKLGVTTAKHVGNAARRNRIKRLIREAFRRGWMDLPARVDVVIVAKSQSGELKTEHIFRDLAALGRKVRQIVEEQS